jgi:hypothetical protein
MRVESNTPTPDPNHEQIAGFIPGDRRDAHKANGKVDIACDTEGLEGNTTEREDQKIDLLRRVCRKPVAPYVFVHMPRPPPKGYEDTAAQREGKQHSALIATRGL